MVYSSLPFIYGFLPASLALYYISPRKLKDIVLLLLSMIFCGFMGLRFLIFIMIFTALNYTAGQIIYRMTGNNTLRLIPLSIGVIFDGSMLFSFRSEYFAWLHAPLGFPAGFFPLGISFVTLTGIGYLFDVYRGNIRAEKNFVRFSLFIMMFPRLLMGPLLSYESFVRISRKRRLRFSSIGAGLTLFVKGLAKKIILADQLFLLCNAVKAVDTGELAVLSAWMGALAYLLCMYFTLSGFADMGAGLGECFGFRFPASFSYPVFSGRIRYFASRWHIQVSHWFRKYVTTPLSDMAGDKGLSKIIFVMVWMIGGFWYGFNLSSAMWGALMGTAILIENRMKKFRLLKTNGIFYSFLVITILSVLLWNPTLRDAGHYLFAMIGGSRILADQLTAYLIRSYIVILLVAVYAATDLFRNTVQRLEKTPAAIVIDVATPVIMTALLALCTALISHSGSSEMLIFKL